MEINDEWLKYIINGRKTVEGRKNNPISWARLKVNDVILAVLPNSNDGHKYQVVEIRYYSSIRKYLEKELEKCLPDIESIEKGIEIYTKFYTEEEIIKYGLMAIELKPLIG